MPRTRFDRQRLKFDYPFVRKRPTEFLVPETEPTPVTPCGCIEYPAPCPEPTITLLTRRSDMWSADVILFPRASVFGYSDGGQEEVLEFGDVPGSHSGGGVEDFDTFTSVGSNVDAGSTIV